MLDGGHVLAMSNPHRLPATPKGMYLSGFCEIGYHAHGVQSAFAPDLDRSCQFEFANPTWAKTIKCACPCHWPKEGRVDRKDLATGSSIPPEPELRLEPSPYAEFLKKTDSARVEGQKIDSPMVDYEGRRKRGGLEEQVRTVCNKYTGSAPLTATVIAKSIEATVGKKPSTGAIAAVFIRWEEREIAEFSHSPTAFRKFL